MSKPENPQAFPHFEKTIVNGDEITVRQTGMTLKDYACIKLKIPKTDYGWLNDLIKESLVNDFAGQVVNTFVQLEHLGADDLKGIANQAYQVAKAMLKEREKIRGEQ